MNQILIYPLMQMWYNYIEIEECLIFNIGCEFEALTNQHQKVYVF